MNNKAQTLASLFIAIILVSMFTISAVLYMQGGGQTYNLNYNNTSFEQFDKSLPASQLASSAEQTITGANASGTTQPTTSNIDLITTSAFKTFPLIAGIPIILGQLFAGIGDIIGIDENIINLAFILILFFIVLIFVLLIFRVDAR